MTTTPASDWDHVILDYVHACNEAERQLHADAAEAFNVYNQAVNAAVRRRNVALANLRAGRPVTEGAATK